RAPDVAIRAVGSYPTFSPLPNALRRNRQGCGFPQSCRRGDSITGGLIFCGTFRSRRKILRSCQWQLRRGLATTPWRYQARRPVVPHSCELRTMGVRTFLPCISLARNTPAIIRLTRWFRLYLGRLGFGGRRYGRFGNGGGRWRRKKIEKRETGD